MNVLLQGIGGSVAHGLAGPGSDVDRYGVYAAPTLDLVVPWSPEHKPSVVTHNPDVSLHEAGKFATMLAGCNPTVMELLWLPPELYEVVTPHGQQLIDMRTDVLAADPIRHRFAGMVGEQARRLRSEERQPQAAKLARHGLRVADQALTLLGTGLLVVQSEKPEQYRRYDDNPWDAIDALWDIRTELICTTSDVLPVLQPQSAITSLRLWVRGVRLANLP